jgi:cell wall-associated NlpC family hydrolase
MSIPRGGNVWTWPDPLHGGSDFVSRAAQLWSNWGESGREDDQQWYNNLQNWSNDWNTGWEQAISEQYFDDSLYSFIQKPFDPYKAVTGFTPSSNFAYAKIMGDIGAWIEREHPELSWFGQNGATVGSASTANLGGEWAGVDKWNSQILDAQKKVQEKTGVFVPGNVIKAIMKIESNGEFLAPNYAGYYGLMQVGPGSWGVGTDWDPALAQTDPAYNIFAGTMELARRYEDAKRINPEYTWANVAVGYFSGGYDIRPGGDRWTSIEQYYDTFTRYLSQLDAAVRGNGGQAGIDASGVLAEAMKYVGVPYEWGAIPGRGDNPWQTGWDCSGFTYWLDQTYGNGQLPQGSHYQYDYARRTGQLYTNISQIAPGDILFFDTGNMAGGGAELNRAGHVGVALGDGKMISALNPGAGTVVSNIAGIGVFLGGMKMGWSAGGGGGPGSYSSYEAVTGGIPEFGVTEWSQGGGAGMYKYAAGLGMPGGHPALDIGTPTGTQLYAGISGTVMIDGGTGVYALEGQEYVPYTGHLQIQLDNGDVVVYGHMYQIDVRVGQRVEANTPIGTSGYYNGPHLHLEYWLNKPHALGAYTAADPRLAMSGNFSGQFGSGVGQGDMQFRAGADNWSAFMRATAEGKPVMGYTAGNSGGSFHGWMKQGMLNGWGATSGTGAQPGQPGYRPGQNTVAGAWGVSFTPQVWSNIQNLSKARS